MATPAIRSSATGAGDAAGSVTVTKPSGTASGDLLVAIVFSFEGVAAVVPSDEAGWTTIGSGSSSFQALKAYWKIAGGSEPANYTFDSPSSVDSLRCIMFAITGHYAAAPIGASAFPTLVSSSTTPSLPVSLYPGRPDALLIMGIISDTSGVGTTASGYNISGTNPTWTEQYDNTEGSDHILGVATATAHDASLITSMGYATSNASDNHVGVLLSIPQQSTASASPSSVAVKVQQSAPSKSAVVNKSAEAIAIRVGQSLPVTEDNNQTWFDEERPESEWINEPLP